MRSSRNRGLHRIETPDESSLAERSKKQNLKRDLVEDVQRIQRAGMQVQAGFFWTLSHRPKLITLAVTLAIHGYHFRMVCDQHIRS